MQHKIIFGIVAMYLFTSCVANESSVFISGMKAPPSPPECESSVSDANARWLTVDLAFRNDISASFHVENRLMVREDYAKPTAETNGVFLEGNEVKVRAVNGTPLGNREYWEFEAFVPAESEVTVRAMVLSPATIELLALQLGCPPKESMDGPIDINDPMVYADVKFLGHTNGGTDVETPSFTAAISLCCGCLISWGSCSSDTKTKRDCLKYCEEPDEPETCISGLDENSEKYDCRNLFYGHSWTIYDEILEQDRPGDCETDCTGSN